MASLFSVVVGFEDVARHKPDPEGVELALGRLGVLPKEALLVGDSAADIEAARAAGCPSCYATWGIQGDTVPLSTSPDYVARSPLNCALWCFDHSEPSVRLRRGEG